MSDNPKPDLIDLYQVPSARLTPKEEPIDNGRYVPVYMDRPGWIVPYDVVAAGTLYVYPGNDAPSADRQAMAYTNGYAPLGGTGRFWVKHSGSARLTFQIRYDGVPGDPASSPIAPAIGLTPPANRSSGFTDQKTVAVPSTAEQLPAHTVPNGFALCVSALATNTREVGIGFSAAAADIATGTPKLLAPGASVRIFVSNSNLLYVDAIVALEGVDLIAEA